MIYKNENQLINIIKFTPPVFIITISIVITFFLYLDKQNELEKEKFFIRSEFIKNNKETANQEVENLYNFISNSQEKTEEKLKENIKNRVYEAHSIATRIYNENKNSKSKDEIKKMIKDALVDIRFNNGSGYFFIYSFDYECILLPINRKLEGTSFYNFKEGKGKYLTRNIITQLKNEKEGFLSWWFNKPDDLENQYKKIGFNMLFEPYNWFIGTGEYFVDFEEIIKKEVLDYISKLNKDKNNYFFIIDYNKNTLLHLIPDLVNKPAIDVTNIENQKIFDEMIEIAKQGEGFLTYNHKPINSDSFSTKTSYIKGINNWQWAIGKGLYQAALNGILKGDNASKNIETTEALKQIIAGMGVFIKSELANERIAVAVLTPSEEDEHSCFSDNTHRDIEANYLGFKNILTATYNGKKYGKSLFDAVDKETKDRIEKLMASIEAKIKSIDEVAKTKAHFDYQIRPDNEQSKVIVKLKNEMRKLGDEMVNVAAANGISLSTDDVTDAEETKI